MEAVIPPRNSAAFGVWKLENQPLQVLRITFFSFAIVFGLIQVVDSRNAMNVDGISYLDMGDAYLRGGWGMLVNGHWSPLYPWLLGVAKALIKPSAYWEFAVLHLVNFFAYVFALLAFDLMLRQVIADENRNSNIARSGTPLPDWALITVSYLIFLWSSLTLNNMENESPDMVMSVFVYLATAIILYLRRSPGSWLAFFSLGAVLGLGYLAKAPMFPLAFVYLGVALILAGNLRRGVPRILLASVVFLSISAPLVVTLSRAKGGFTFGESAKLNQLWMINDAEPRWYWQNSSLISGRGFSVGRGRGEFRHPPRLIFENPPVYEFMAPLPGTQPAWYDPSYWIEGSAAGFEPRRQLSVFVDNLGVYFNLLFTKQASLVVVLLVLGFIGGIGNCFRGIIAQWPMLVTAFAALSMYALVLVHERYVAVFLAVAWIGLFAGLRLPAARESRNLALAASVAMLIAVGAPLTLAAAHSLAKGIRHRPHPQWEVAQALRQMGVVPGDRVARVGGTFGAGWARLLRARVVAEIPRTSAPKFWTSGSLVQERVIEAFRKTGAKVVVAQQIPPLEVFAATPGWQRIGNTDFYVFQCQPSKLPE